ncbi:hypothetical protein RN001_010549 [Aquatica leii]|uniref:Major facilitator superfamily (MFS) profile domain-containing protein n=1 Tax=Aquatica leii TaxID=1421715 RepID=A0AAN7QHJ3_9COLE|nr:hypothetical protein RN001_010549 [Aquatica leii]
MEENQIWLKEDVGGGKWLGLLPQGLAVMVVSSLHLVIGQIIAYSGILIPQMMLEQNVGSVDAIPITESDSAWIASAPVFSGLAASALAGILIDYFGRLKTIMLSSVSGVIGLFLIATASNMSMIISGRIMMGITLMLIGNPTAVYISEISRPDVRGSFLIFVQVFMSIVLYALNMEENQIWLEKDVGGGKWLGLLPQALAVMVVSSLHLVIGQIIAYSGILIPQMMLEQNVGSVDAIPITESDSAWIASAPVFSGLAASALAGILIDYFGRLKTIMLSSVSGVIGLFLIATASNMSMIISGRIMMGITLMLIGNPTAVYISEISRPDVRGSFLIFVQVFMSIVLYALKMEENQIWLEKDVGGGKWLGLLPQALAVMVVSSLHLVIGQIIAYSGILIPQMMLEQNVGSVDAIPITESDSAWIASAPVFSGLAASALAGILIDYFGRLKTIMLSSVSGVIGLFLIATASNMSMIISGRIMMGITLMLIGNPTAVYISEISRPDVRGSFLIFVQVFMSIEIGTDINPYLASIYISGIKVIMSFVTTVLMKKFNRRTLLLISAGGMGLCMTVSGLNTHWIQQGTSSHTWIPLGCLLLYITFSAMGITSVPFMIAVEMFPLKIRGIAYGLIITLMNLFTFAVLQCYFPLYHVFGGSANLQYFFAVMSVAVMIVIYVFLPETHKQRLIDIENYFWKHTIYIASQSDRS